MIAIVLPAGSNNSAWVTPSYRTTIVLGKIGDVWNGTVNIYARRKADIGSATVPVDADRFLVKAYTGPAAEVFAAEVADNLEIRFEGVGTNVPINISLT